MSKGKVIMDPTSSRNNTKNLSCSWKETSTGHYSTLRDIAEHLTGEGVGMSGYYPEKMEERKRAR